MDEVQTQVTQIVEWVSPMSIRILALRVRTREEVALASDELRKLKDVQERIEAVRVALVKPLNDHVKIINAEFKRHTEVLDKLEVFVKSLLTSFREKEKAELEAIAEKARLANPEIASLVILPEEKTVKGQQSQVTFSKVWKAEVVDFSQLPDKYKLPDMVAINEAVKAGQRIIPGVRIHQVEIPSIRRRVDDIPDDQPF